MFGNSCQATVGEPAVTLCSDLTPHQTGEPARLPGRLEGSHRHPGHSRALIYLPTRLESLRDSLADWRVPADTLVTELLPFLHLRGAHACRNNGEALAAVRRVKGTSQFLVNGCRGGL